MDDSKLYGTDAFGGVIDEEVSMKSAVYLDLNLLS